MHRVLIVDDDSLIRSLLGAVLAEGHEVVEAAGGAAALRACDLDGPFDLIMVDWMMPGMSGVELIREIRKDRGRLGSIPIIMLTAKDGIDAEEEAYQAGADAYLTKPFSPEIVESLADVMILASSPGRTVHRASRVRPQLAEA